MPGEVHADLVVDRELPDALPASPAGRAGENPSLAIRRPDRDFRDPESRAFGGDARGDRARLGAIAQRIGRILDIRTAVDGSARRTHRDADVNAGIRRMRVAAAFARGSDERIASCAGSRCHDGAGDGNRTHTISLEG